MIKPKKVVKMPRIKRLCPICNEVLNAYDECLNPKCPTNAARVAAIRAYDINDLSAKCFLCMDVPPVNRITTKAGTFNTCADCTSLVRAEIDKRNRIKQAFNKPLFTHTLGLNTTRETITVVSLVSLVTPDTKE